MNKPKHTPGPWTVKNLPDQGSYKILECATAEHKAEFNGSLLCETNARLIAAAPDYAEQFDALIEHLTHLNSLGKLPNDKKLNRMIRDGFDLITKATGGAE